MSYLIYLKSTEKRMSRRPNCVKKRNADKWREFTVFFLLCSQDQSRYFGGYGLIFIMLRWPVRFWVIISFTLLPEMALFKVSVF